MGEVVSITAKIGVIDIVSLDERERVAILIHLAGHPDSAVTLALLAATQKVLARTRGGEV